MQPRHRSASTKRHHNAQAVSPQTSSWSSSAQHALGFSRGSSDLRSGDRIDPHIADLRLHLHITGVSATRAGSHLDAKRQRVEGTPPGSENRGSRSSHRQAVSRSLVYTLLKEAGWSVASHYSG